MTSKPSIAVLGLLFAALANADMRSPPECAGHVCNTREHPVLRYNGTCYCESHPCPKHSCEKVEGFPVLAFDYNSKGELDCYCRIKCPDNFCGGERIPPECSREEHHCPNAEYPILALVDGECKCQTHPCVAAGRGKCPSTDAPWLDYSYDREGKLDCYCRPDPCRQHVCSDPTYPHVRFDQEGHCYCSTVPFNPPPLN
mmetsp:Transcript_11237/g.31287  ORF Transcript_11237/g.31287 Transcript_11237/m.31287 type:complete len:199 (+) Transcript_11237:71-667(+)